MYTWKIIAHICDSHPDNRQQYAWVYRSPRDGYAHIETAGTELLLQGAYCFWKGHKKLTDLPKLVWHTQGSDKQNSNDLIYNLRWLSFHEGTFI